MSFCKYNSETKELSKFHYKNKSTIIHKIILLFSLVAIIIFGYVSLMYPVKYTDIIERECSIYNVESTLVKAVINSESSFNKNAVSRVGAIGLMQLMPKTAEWCCEMIGIEYDESSMTNPDYNIKLGTYYLSYLLLKFDVTNAIASYNAGEGNVAMWLQEGLDTIPFEETRNYVKNVKRAIKIYSILRA